MYGTLKNANQPTDVKSQQDQQQADGPSSGGQASEQQQQKQQQHSPQTPRIQLQMSLNGGFGPDGDNFDDSDRVDNKRILSHCHIQSSQASSCGGSQANKIDKGARNRLIAVSLLCLLFMIGEVAGGILSNSLAIAADAAHLLTDLASFMMSLFALWLASRPASREMSFGWYRAEVIGALLSVLMIWVVTGLLVYTAVERLRTQQFEVDSLVMVITASAGLVVNIIMATALHVGGSGHHHHHHHHNHSHSHQDHLEEEGEVSRHASLDRLVEGTSVEQAGQNSAQDSGSSREANDCVPAANRGSNNINVRAAFIHVVGDFVQSIGVLIAALVIHFKPEYAIVDPICTFIFSVIVLVTTIGILRDATNVLMEGIPNGINFIEVRERLQKLPGVIRVHNLRIWSLSMEKIAISTHLVIDNNHTPSATLKLASDKLKSCYNFFEITIQIEEYRDDMRNCEKCLDEKVIIEPLKNISYPQHSNDQNIGG